MNDRASVGRAPGAGAFRAGGGLLKQIVARLWCILFLLLLLLHPTPAARAQGARPQTIDKIVAIVNADPILWSDILWQVALAPDGDPQKLDAELEDRVLQAIIDTRLLHQEAEKLPAISVTDAEIDRALAKLVASFSSEETFRARAQSADLTPDTIRDILKHRIEVEKYTDFRFRSFVVVRDDEVAAYYEKELQPQMKARGEVRSLDQSRLAIVALLTADKVSQEMEKWIADARERSDIVIIGHTSTPADRKASRQQTKSSPH